MIDTKENIFADGWSINANAMYYVVIPIVSIGFKNTEFYTQTVGRFKR